MSILISQISKTPEKLIVGSWESDSGDDVTFYEDGTMIMGEIPATYTIDEDKTLHIKGLGLFEAATLEWNENGRLYSRIDDGEWYINGSELKLEEDIYIKE